VRVVPSPAFARALQRAVDDELVAAALVDRDGKLIAQAGTIGDGEARPLAATVIHRLKDPDLASRMLAGEIVSYLLDGRHVAVGIAKRRLFVVGVLPGPICERFAELRDEIEKMLTDLRDDGAPWPGSGGSGGTGSGPAELPLVELGITVGRERGKA